MNIAVNTRLLLKGKLEGMGYFSFEVLRRMVLSMPEHTFYFIFDRPYDSDFIFADNVIPIVVSPPTRHPVLWFIWFEWRVARILKKLKSDVFLSMDNFCILNTKIRTILVQHDISFVHYPQEVPRLVNAYYKYFVPKFLKKADRIITVSEFCQGDILSIYKNISPEKITVAYNGCREAFKPISDNEKETTKKTFTNGAPYFIYVGSINPRKNIDTLIKAFDKFKTHTNSNVKLVLVGRVAWQKEKVMSVYKTSKFKDDIIFMGYVEERLLPTLLGSALALTYISLFEGFGVPLIEAMSAEVPVITSNCTAMPEIANNAALLVNPMDIDEIANALQNIYTDVDLRTQLIAKGKIRKNNFSWNTTSEIIQKIILDNYATF